MAGSREGRRIVAYLEGWSWLSQSSLAKSNHVMLSPSALIRVNSAKHLYDGIRDPSVAGNRSLRVTTRFEKATPDDL
jgi:hypothetical protein